MMVIMEESASVVLLIASARMDTELAAMPMASLNADRKRFHAAPNALVLMISLFLFMPLQIPPPLFARMKLPALLACPQGPASMIRGAPIIVR